MDFQSGAWVNVAVADNVDLGTCTATLNKELPDVYTTNVATCIAAPDQDSCGSQQLCVPSPPMDFQNRICVYRTGDVDCNVLPDYTEKFSRYNNITDTRDCETCTCDNQGTRCGGTVTFHADTDCSGDSTTITMSNEPVSFDEFDTICTEGHTGSYSSFNIENWKPECAPSGGDKIGEAAFTDPITFCCTP